MSGALREAVTRGLLRGRCSTGCNPAAHIRRFAERVEVQEARTSAKVHGQGAGGSTVGLAVAVALGLGGAYYLFSEGVHSHRSYDSSSEPGSQKHQQTKRPPRLGQYPHQAPEKAQGEGGEDTSAQVTQVLDRETDSKSDTAGNELTRGPDNRGRGSDFAATNKDPGPNKPVSK